MDKKQKDVINKLIPADDLYWDKEEKKYIALSPEEIDKIMYTAIDNGFTEEKDVIDILNWATSVKVGELLLKHFMQGGLAISGIDDSGEPFFTQNINGNC